MSLTPTQRKILCLMREHGTAHFSGLTREFHNWLGSNGGLYIRAYQMPEYFLKGRGLIEKTPSNHDGIWYRLTPAGETLAARTTWPDANLAPRFGSKWKRRAPTT